MNRVAGADPGTSSLDWLILHSGQVVQQVRFTPQQLQENAGVVVDWLRQQGPFAAIVGPSGYGVPLKLARDCTEADIEQLALVRPEESGQASGVHGFTALVRQLRAAVDLPVYFLPGVIHLPTVPLARKIQRIDLGTADKLCVAFLAWEQRRRRMSDPAEAGTFCLVELGSAFSACVVLRQGRIVAGAGGTSGPGGFRSAGDWDGEAAYWLGPLRKADLFRGGYADIADRFGEAVARTWLSESLVRQVVAWQTVEPFTSIVLSGRLLETMPSLAAEVRTALSRLGTVEEVSSLPGAWVKHAAQGAARIAEQLANGDSDGLLRHFGLWDASGQVTDYLTVR